MKNNSFERLFLRLKNMLTYISILALMAQFIVIQMPIANAAVTAPSSVTVVDNDTTDPGISGSDFSVSFTAAAADSAETFKYSVYIIEGSETSPSSIADLSNLQSLMENIPSNVTSFVMPDFVASDSGTDVEADNQSPLATGNYKVCVATFVDNPDSAESKVACSASTAIAADVVADTVGPFINFFPAHSMITGTNAVYNMVVRDAQSSSANITTTLVWGEDVSDATETDITCALANVGDSHTVCTIAWATVNGAGLSGSDFEYYIKSTDDAASPNTSYFCANPNATSDADCKASPLTTAIIAAGSRTVAGTVTVSGPGDPLTGAAVFPGGYAVASVTADGSGDYTLSSLPNNTAFDIMAYSAGFCESVRFETIGSSNLTGIDLSLPTGECVVSNDAGSGGGGGSGKPHKVFSSPPEFDNFAPIEADILVGFDTPLNSVTITDSDASDIGSNVYLSTFSSAGSETKVAGSVTYCANSDADGCSSLMTGDNNVILFNPTADLTASKTYTLVVTEGVTSGSGSSIEGNRPGGGLKLTFTTGNGTVTFNNANFGSGGQYMPPYVESVMPGPGSDAAPNANIIVKFNESMDTSTLTTSNVKLLDSDGAAVSTVITVNSDKKTLKINPASNLSTGEYQVQILGAAANASGVTMRAADQSSSSAFSSYFNVSGSADTTAPTVYSLITTGSTDVSVNQGSFEYGFSEPMDPSTITTSNITMLRGNNSVPFNVTYNPGPNNLFVNPTNVLAPNTAYTITITTSVTDAAGVALAANNVVSFTTGSSDTAKPDLREVDCDNYACFVRFSEPMNNSTLVDGATEWALSVLNPDNIAFQVESSPGSGTYGSDLITDDTAVNITYDSGQFGIHADGLVLTADDVDTKFKLTVTAAADLSDNVINTVSSANVLIGKLKDNRETFGDFGGGGGGMFGPPKSFFGDDASGTAGGEFKPAGFGDFTAEQFAFGQADTAFPFNMTASQDVNVFQTRFTPGVVLADGDIIQLTFPSGTTVTSAEPDTFSPFFDDMNEFETGTIALDTVNDGVFGTNGLSAVTAARTVSVELDVTGTPPANAAVTLDLRKITNPSIPRGPGSAGYTVGIKIIRGGETIINKDSMPYFINAAGSNSITVDIFAGSSETPVSGANGDVFLFGGGPSGPMDKNVTLTNGDVTAVDGSALTSIAYTGLNDGCYYFGTEPFVTLGGVDYYGQSSPDPVCVDSGNSSATKNIVLSSAESAGASVPVTVKLAGIADFGGVDMEIFAGGPSNFVVKTLSAVGTPNGAGYTLRLPNNGNWFVGIGPAMPKTSTKMPDPLPGVAPPSLELVVSGIGGTPAVSAGFGTSPGATFVDETDTLTFTFATADKAITGTVTDGSTGLADVEVFLHSQGFGQPTFTRTSSDGTFTLNVSDYGQYEIGAWKGGLKPSIKQIEIKTDGADAGSDPDIFFKGKQITGENPLVLTIKKPDYTISGKILDADGNGVAYAPVFATDANGEFVGDSTFSDGSYTLFVDAGTWTVKSELPPDKTDVCGTYSKTVTVTTESKSSQNVSPTAGTCYTLSGTVTLAGSTYENAPVFVEEWDTVNDRPAGGMFRPTKTNSSGVYTTKVGPGTYRVGAWTPEYGEISTTTTVTASSVTDAHVTTGSTADITFAFTGGTATQEAFIEVRKSDDKHVRFGKNQQGLASNVTMTMKEGTYNYFVNVFGVGDFTGTVATGATATIDLSTADMVTLSGNVDDGDGTDLAGVLVTAQTSDGRVRTATTDASGDYSMEVKADDYTISVGLAGYVPSQAPETATIAASTTYDFGAAGDQTGLTQAATVISGTVYQSDGSTPVTSGFVTAENTDGLAVVSAINPSDGTYSLPVTDGTWTVEGTAPVHAKTVKPDAVVVAGSDVTGQDITLAADATRITKSASGAVAANVGGTINDTENSGIKFTAGSGVLEAGSSDVTVTTEKSFTAPDTDTYDPLGDASFAISASGSSTIKTLSGNAEITLDYADLVADLPSGVEETDLKMVYFSTEKNEYVQVEGGFSIDATNNTITGAVDHLTDFAIVYSPPAAAAVAAAAASSSSGGGGGGGVVSLVSQTVKKSVAAVAVKAVTSLSENVVDDKYVPVGTEGKVLAEVSLRNVETQSYYTVAIDTEVTDEDGKKYVGDLAPPVVSTATAKAPKGLTMASDVFDLKADKAVKFSKPVTVVLPVKSTVSKDSKVNVYYLDEVKNSWKLLGPGTVKTLDGKKVAEFKTDHFTKFAVMKLPNVMNFGDVASHWAKSYVDRLSGMEIIKGYSDGTFKPDNNITRAEFAKIVVEAFDIAVPDAKDINYVAFGDVDKGAWYWKYVYAAYEADVVKGFKDGSFMPNRPVNRAEALKMLLEAAGTDVGTTVSTGFEDIFYTSWYGKYVSYAVKKKLVQGYDDNTFRPARNMSRGEVSKLVSLMLDMK